MSKANKTSLHFSVERMCPDSGFGKTSSDSDFHIKDKRLPHLLVVLRQLDEFIHGLEALPEPELTEIVSAALRVCGFVEPMEAYQVIATVLEALEMQDPIPQTPPFWADSGPPS